MHFSQAEIKYLQTLSRKNKYRPIQGLKIGGYWGAAAGCMLAIGWQLSALNMLPPIQRLHAEPDHEMFITWALTGAVLGACLFIGLRALLRAKLEDMVQRFLAENRVLDYVTGELVDTRLATDGCSVAQSIIGVVAVLALAIFGTKAPSGPCSRLQELHEDHYKACRRHRWRHPVGFFETLRKSLYLIALAGFIVGFVVLAVTDHSFKLAMSLYVVGWTLAGLALMLDLDVIKLTVSELCSALLALQDAVDAVTQYPDKQL